MDVTQVTAEFSADDSNFQAGVRNSKKAVDDLKNHVERTKLTLQAPDLKNFGNAFRVEGIAEAEKATLSLRDSVNEALNGIQGFTNLGTRAFRQLTIAATAASAAIGLIAKRTVDIGGGFESQMARVRAISGATSEEFSRLSDKARELGAVLPITARDAASAMEVLAQRGTSVGDILGNVEDIINLSISQQYGLAESADVVSAAMLNFGLTADKSREIVDAFNNAANDSALSMSSLGMALSYVAPNANALGMSLYQTVAAMQALADAGFTGQRIGTGLTNVLTSLSAPSDKATTTLARLGVQVNDTMGKMRTLEEIFIDLRDANMSFTDAVEIFGVTGSRFATVLAKNSGSLAQNERNLQKAGSTAANVAIQLETLRSKWNAFTSAAEENYIKVFSQGEGQVKRMVDELAELTRSMGAWIDKTRVAERAVDSFFRGLGVGDGTIKGLSAAFNDMMALRIEDFFEKSGKAIRSVTEAIGELASAVPWDLIIGNLDKIAKAAFWGMILDKGVGIASGAVIIAAGLKAIATGAQGAALGLVALGGKAAVITALLAGPVVMLYKAVRSAEELGETIQYLEQTKQSTEYLKEYIRVLEGEVELLDELPLKYRELYEEQQKRVIAEDKQTIADQLKKDYEESRITIEEFKKSLKQLEDAASAADYENIKAAESFMNRYEKIMNDMMGGKLTGIEADHLTITLMAEFDESGLNFHELMQEVHNKIAQNPINISRAFTIEDLKPRFEKEADEIITALEVKLTAAEREFGRGSIAFEAVVTEAFKAAIATADGLADELEKAYGPSAMIAFSRHFRELGESGHLAFARIGEGMKGTKAEVTVLSEHMSIMRDRIKYLGESPTGLQDTLENLLKTTPKLNEATGKLNEEYKIWRDMLDDINKTSLSQAKTQVESLSKAVQAGFLDSSALKKPVEALLIELDREVRDKVNRDMAGASATVKEGVRRSEMQAEVTKLGIPELTKAFYDFFARMGNIESGFTSVMSDRGVPEMKRQKEVWDDMSSGVSSATDSMKMFEISSKSATEGLNKITEISKNYQPAAPGTVPLSQDRDIRREQGTTELAGMTAVTTAMHDLRGATDSLSGKLDTHGGKIDAQTSAIEDLITALKQGLNISSEQSQSGAQGNVGVTINIHDFVVKKDAAASEIARIVKQELQKVLRSPALNGA